MKEDSEKERCFQCLNVLQIMEPPNLNECYMHLEDGKYPLDHQWHEKRRRVWTVMKYKVMVYRYGRYH